MNKKLVIIILVIIMFVAVMEVIPDSSASKTVSTSASPANQGLTFVPYTSSITPYGAAPMLWQTESFNGVDPNGHIVFWGTAWYYYLEYGVSESNPSYNWYIIAITINNANHADSNEIGGILSSMQLYAQGPSWSEWNVNAQPIDKTPLESPTVSVGTSSAGISFALDYYGYDSGTVYYGNGASSYGIFDWTHKFTIADQHQWNYLAGAYCGKTGASSSQENALGEVYVQFYMWWTGGWNPFGGTSGWINAQYTSGSSGSVYYPQSTA